MKLISSIFTIGLLFAVSASAHPEKENLYDLDTKLKDVPVGTIVYFMKNLHFKPRKDTKLFVSASSEKTRQCWLKVTALSENGGLIEKGTNFKISKVNSYRKTHKERGMRRGTSYDATYDYAEFELDSLVTNTPVLTLTCTGRISRGSYKIPNVWQFVNSFKDTAKLRSYVTKPDPIPDIIE